MKIYLFTISIIIIYGCSGTPINDNRKAWLSLAELEDVIKGSHFYFDEYNKGAEIWISRTHLKYITKGLCRWSMNTERKSMKCGLGK